MERNRARLLEIETAAVGRSPYKSSSTCRVCGRFLQSPAEDWEKAVRENAQGCCDEHLETE